ncbi:ribosomal protein S8 [Medicago truncatula]|uniref:Small ribosomal subunit protein uS8c n=1 Tax=Medicago truncatula TaxID=3880 RepID=G7JPG4_MEDTR|nr:ribosomal protein S8 [Medicago truncatula]
MNRKRTVQIPLTTPSRHIIWDNIFFQSDIQFGTEGVINITENIVKILLREGFVENVRKHRENNKYFLVLTLRYKRNRKESYKTFLNLKRIKTPGLRIYSNYQQIPRVLGGMGIVILSTSRGIMTDREARLERIGGEVLCYI